MILETFREQAPCSAIIQALPNNHIYNQQNETTH